MHIYQLTDKTDELAQCFADYLKGKNIAVVRRSELLNTLKQGDYIDSYNLVFRIRSNVPYSRSGILFPYGINSFARHTVNL